MQVRFGIVLLVIVSIVSFMLGRSTKILLTEKEGAAAQGETSPGGVGALSADEGAPLAAAGHDGGLRGYRFHDESRSAGVL